MESSKPWWKWCGIGGSYLWKLELEALSYFHLLSVLLTSNWDIPSYDPDCNYDDASWHTLDEPHEIPDDFVDCIPSVLGALRTSGIGTINFIWVCLKMWYTRDTPQNGNFKDDKSQNVGEFPVIKKQLSQASLPVLWFFIYRSHLTLYTLSAGLYLKIIQAGQLRSLSKPWSLTFKRWYFMIFLSLLSKQIGG